MEVVLRPEQTELESGAHGSLSMAEGIEDRTFSDADDAMKEPSNNPTLYLPSSRR